ncbi:MAG: PAS domain-containing protein [Deltaproteobacteria bacterium]|nr:PAS domain-containing protein [Deltaproteobacteria bacterium]
MNEGAGGPVAGRPLAAAIVGGGKGCASFLEMVANDTLGRFRLRILGVAGVDPQGPGMRAARELAVPLVTTDYRELFRIPDLDVLIELTGSVELRDEIERTRPRHVRLIDHFGARLFWELNQVVEAVIRQRTEMRQRDEAERRRIAEVLDSIPDEILVLDADLVVRDANATFLVDNGITIEEIRGRHCYEVDQITRGGCQVAVGDCPFFAVAREGQPVSIVRKHFAPDGETRYAAIVGAPLKSADGKVVGLIEMTRDITARIRLEEDLRTTEVRLQQFTKLAPLATYVKNRAGQYVDVNPATCALFGRPAAEILGRTDHEFLPREAADEMSRGDRETWRRGSAVTVDVEVQLGGRRVFLSTIKFPILDAAGQPTALCGLSMDITAQKEAENQLLETRKRLQDIMDNSPVIIVTTDIDGRVQSFNRGAERSLGYAAEEVVGRSDEPLYADPASRAEFLRMVRAGKSVQDDSGEMRRKDGTLLPVSVTMSALRDAEGTLIGTVAMNKDISQRKALMAQVLQSERMAAVGRVAAGVAHEINNPLAVIGEIAGYLDSVAADAPADAATMTEVRGGLPKILRQVERVREITRRLLSFARKTEARIEAADVNASLDEILPFLEKEARLAQATIHRQYGTGLPRVAVEEMQLQEVFINLISNAIHALGKRGGGGNVWLTTSVDGEKVTVSVRDDGPGIDESVRDRLFEPFVTTKPTGQGTGLGLSICYGIVKRYDGEIRVFSEAGEGAVFEVVLPAHR